MKRYIIDIVFLVITLAAFIQWHFIGLDITYGYIIIPVYVTFVIIRFRWTFNEILKQDQEIKKLNETISEKDQFIEELIKKYGVTTKQKQSFKDKLNDAFRKKRNETH